MADRDEIKAVGEEAEDGNHLNYKTPDKKSLKEIQELDKDVESLIKYKPALLGSLPAVVDPNAPNMQVTAMELICADAPGPIKMDLTGNVMCDLRYVQNTFKTGIKVDKETHMIGSYGPRCKPYEFLTPAKEAPKGMLARGMYSMKSWFTNDDKTNHLHWEWKISIKKE